MRKPDGSRPTYVSLFLFDFWLVTFSKVVSTPLKHTPSPRGGFKHFFFSSLPGKMIQFDKYIFQLGTSNSLTFTKGNRRSPGLCHIQVIHCYTDEDQIPMNLEESDAQQKACRWMPWMSCVFFLNVNKNSSYPVYMFEILDVCVVHTQTPFSQHLKDFFFWIFHFLGSEVCPDSWLCVSFPQSGLHLGGALNPWVFYKRCGNLPGVTDRLPSMSRFMESLALLWFSTSRSASRCDTKQNIQYISLDLFLD